MFPTGSYVAYTKNVCWISNTYYVPLGDSIPRNISEREDKEISYYQWVPIILLFQALMFKVGGNSFPCLSFSRSDEYEYLTVYENLFISENLYPKSKYMFFSSFFHFLSFVIIKVKIWFVRRQKFLH